MDAYNRSLPPELVARALHDAGCPRGFVEEFLARYGSCTPRAQLRLLEGQRRQLLEQLHDYRRRLECLDYLRHQIERGAPSLAAERDV